MVPVLRDNKPSLLPTAPWLKFGYNVSFDDQGQGQDNGLAIDFGAMVDHLTALKQAVAAHGLAIEVIIFAPDLQDNLAAHGGSSLLTQLRFSRNPSWVRHDDHYHIDFR